MNNLFKQEESFVELLSMKPGQEGDIPTSDDLSGIELRLSKVLIIDNKTIKLPLFPGLAQMYLLVIVVSDLDNTVQNLDLKGFPKVDDNEELPIDKTIFYWKKDDANKAPGQIHAFVSVIKSKEALRNAGDILSKVKNDTEYTDLVDNIKSILTKGTAFGQVTDTLFTMASIVGKYLGNVKDRPLLTWMQSFTDINGDLNTLGKTTREKRNDDALMGMTLIVRDKNREKEAFDKLPEDVRSELAPDADLDS